MLDLLLAKSILLQTLTFMHYEKSVFNIIWIDGRFPLGKFGMLN